MSGKPIAEQEISLHCCRSCEARQTSMSRRKFYFIILVKNLMMAKEPIMDDNVRNQKLK
jgi:hypothetical protein